MIWKRVLESVRDELVDDQPAGQRAVEVQRNAGCRLLRRVRFGMLVRIAQRIAAALTALSGVPLSRELRIILHTDKVACYRKMRGLYRRCPGIDGKIDGAQRAANAQGAPASGGVGPIENDHALRQIIGVS